MCNFFSFLTDGNRKLYYFSGEQRRNRVTFRDGQKVPTYDSHTSIARYYGLNEDDWSKGEYNPFTDKLTIDQQHTTWDEDKVRGMLAGVDWRPLCGDLDEAREFLRELKTIPWFKLDGTLRDGDGIKVFDTMEAAWDAAWNVVGDAARSAACGAARDAAWGVVWGAVMDTAVIASQAAVQDAELYIRVIHVCDGLPIAQEHIDHVRKRMDVCRHGYGVLCDVDGVLYCYKRIGK